MKKAKAIIFDMDGVLVDSEPHHVKIEKELFAKLNLEISDEEHSTYMGKATDVMWKEIFHDKNISLDIEQLINQSNIESKNYFSALKEIEPMPGLVKVLESFIQKGIPMAVASSSGPETIGIILNKAGLDKYFLHIVNSKMVGKSKPEPDIFLHTAALLSVKPEECLVIEDSTNGIRAAKSANMICVAYNGTSANNQDQGLADEQITDYSQLESIVGKYMKF
ncbi:MAG: HAD family phosphatase [Draconibacterium sp.]|nr:HAD family phosphatase [Draconibacterium sp.]